MKRITSAAALVACAALAASCAQEQQAEPAPDAAVSSAEPSLDAVREATEKYRDVNVALADGYMRDPNNMCDVAPMMGFPPEAGAMGIHYVRADLLGITTDQPRVDGTGTHTDFLRPAVLMYEPQADGSLALVGVENLVFIKAWEAAGNTEPPSYQGVVWDRMVDDPNTELDEAHHFEPHYDRHVWLYRENPNGIYTQFNPAVTCEHHQGTPHGHEGAED